MDKELVDSNGVLAKFVGDIIDRRKEAKEEFNIQKVEIHIEPRELSNSDIDDFEIRERPPARFSQDDLNYACNVMDKLIENYDGLFQSDQQRNAVKTVTEFKNCNFVAKVYESQGVRKTYQFDKKGITKKIYFNGNESRVMFTRSDLL